MIDDVLLPREALNEKCSIKRDCYYYHGWWTEIGRETQCPAWLARQISERSTARQHIILHYVGIYCWLPTMSYTVTTQVIIWTKMKVAALSTSHAQQDLNSWGATGNWAGSFGEAIQIWLLQKKGHAHQNRGDIQCLLMDIVYLSVVCTSYVVWSKVEIIKKQSCEQILYNESFYKFWHWVFFPPNSVKMCLFQQFLMGKNQLVQPTAAICDLLCCVPCEPHELAVF